MSKDCKEIQPVHSKGDQSWVFFGRNDAKAETPVLWPPHAKSWLIGKDSDAGRDWGQEEKGTTEDEMAGWHHRLDGHEFEWTPGVGDGQGGLACCDSWGGKESDTTERLSWMSVHISPSSLQKRLLLQLEPHVLEVFAECTTLGWTGCFCNSRTFVCQVFPTLFDDNLCISLLDWKVRSEDRNCSYLIHLHIPIPLTVLDI